MPREVPEWIGKTPDTPPPRAVKLRILAQYDHRDYITGIPFRPGDQIEFDHRIQLAIGGENRESNLAPILAARHREKSKVDAAIKAKVDRLRAAHLGLKPKGRGWNRKLRRRVDGTVVTREE